MTMERRGWLGLLVLGLLAGPATLPGFDLGKAGAALLVPAAWSVLSNVMAIALAVHPVREGLSAPPLRLPGTLLPGVIVDRVAGPARVARAYWRERA